MAHLNIPYQIETILNVTASRTFAVTYTNLTGKNIYVIINLECLIAIAGGTASSVFIINGDANANVGLFGTPVQDIVLQLTAFVKPNATYKLNKTEVGGGTINILRWIESF